MSTSYAGEAGGIDDPEEAHWYQPNGTCHLERCDDDVCTHVVMQWEGNGYTRRNSWIKCDNKYVVDLEDVQ